LTVEGTEQRVYGNLVSTSPCFFDLHRIALCYNSSTKPNNASNVKYGDHISVAKRNCGVKYDGFLTLIFNDWCLIEINTCKKTPFTIVEYGENLRIKLSRIVLTIYGFSEANYASVWFNVNNEKRYSDYNHFPEIGNIYTTYIDSSTNITYIWDGEIYTGGDGWTQVTTLNAGVIYDTPIKSTYLLDIKTLQDQTKYFIECCEHCKECNCGNSKCNILSRFQVRINSLAGNIQYNDIGFYDQNTEQMYGDYHLIYSFETSPNVPILVVAWSLNTTTVDIWWKLITKTNSPHQIVINYRSFDAHYEIGTMYSCGNMNNILDHDHIVEYPLTVISKYGNRMSLTSTVDYSNFSDVVIDNVSFGKRCNYGIIWPNLVVHNMDIDTIQYVSAMTLIRMNRTENNGFFVFEYPFTDPTDKWIYIYPLSEYSHIPSFKIHCTHHQFKQNIFFDDVICIDNEYKIDILNFSENLEYDKDYISRNIDTGEILIGQYHLSVVYLLCNYIRITTLQYIHYIRIEIITRNINNNELIKIHPLTYTKYRYEDEPDKWYFNDGGYFHIEDERTQVEYTFPYFQSIFNEPYDDSFDKVNLFIKIKVDTFNLPELPDEIENTTTINYKFRCVNAALQDLPNVFNVLPIPYDKASLYVSETDQIYDTSTIHHFNFNFNKLNVCDNPTCRLYKNIIAFPYLTSQKLLEDTLKLKGKKIKLIPNERYSKSPYAIFQPSQKRDMFYECEIGHVYLDTKLDENGNEIITICATTLNIKAHNIARFPHYSGIHPYNPYTYELTDNLAQCIWNTDEISPGEIMGNFTLKMRVYITMEIEETAIIESLKIRCNWSKIYPFERNPINTDNDNIFYINIDHTFEEIYFEWCKYLYVIYNDHGGWTTKWKFVNIRITHVTDEIGNSIRRGTTLFNGCCTAIEQEYCIAIDDVLYHTEFNPMWFI